MDIDELRVTLKMLEIDYFYVPGCDLITVYNNVFKDKQTENLFLDIVKNNNLKIKYKQYLELTNNGNIKYSTIYQIYIK